VTGPRQPIDQNTLLAFAILVAGICFLVWVLVD
jgi:hypothetical protein